MERLMVKSVSLFRNKTKQNNQTNNHKKPYSVVMRWDSISKMTLMKSCKLSSILVILDESHTHSVIRNTSSSWFNLLYFSSWGSSDVAKTSSYPHNLDFNRLEPSYFRKWKYREGIQLHFCLFLLQTDLKQSHQCSEVCNQYKTMHNINGWNWNCR